MDVFQPLSKDYCIYFYILSILGFAGFILGVLVFGWVAINKKKEWDFYFNAGYICSMFFLFYFQSRLFYGMCVK